MSRFRGIALLVMAVALASVPAPAAAAFRRLLDACTKPNSPEVKRYYHNSYAVNDFSKNCVAPINAPCHASQGCSLYDRMEKACNDKRQSARCGTSKGFVYTGRYKCTPSSIIPGQSDQGHVISIAVAPVRGMEDVHDSPTAAAETANMFRDMWSESLANHTGTDLHQGFTARSGGLVINPPAHREFHQLHIHAGTWRTHAFELCLAGLTVSKGWQLAKCSGLSEGGEVNNCAPKGSCQSATFAYKTVTDLSDVWSEYKDGLQQLATANAVHGAAADELKYFAGVIVTRGPALAGRHDEKFVIVYTPRDTDPQNGLGRGHFLLKGEPHSDQHPQC